MQWSKVLLFVYLGLSVSYVKGESQTGIVTGDAPDAVVNFINKTDSSYSMHAQPGDGWIFTEDFSWSGPNGWYSDTKYSIACERLPLVETVFVDASLCFSASMNGKMYKPGGQGGSAIPWSISSALHVSPQPYIYPAESVFAKGEPQPLRYVVDSAMTNAPGGLWKYSGATVGGESVQTNWQNMGASYTLPTSLDAGLYSVYAARNTNGAFQAFSAVTLVGVKQVSATFGETTIISTTDSPGADQTLVVPVGASAFNVSATPHPGNVWPSLYPKWKQDMTPVGTNGNVTYSFNPATKGLYEISAFCGDSFAKTLKIATVEVNLTLTSSAICAKPDITSAPTEWGLENSEFEKEITVATDPAGYEDKIALDIKTLSPSQTDKGNITKNNNTKWNYTALTESKSNLNPGGSNRVWSITIEDDFSNKTKRIMVKSVFAYLVTSSKADKQNKAIAYVVWKYGLGSLYTGSYDSSVSDYGSTVGYGLASVIKYGTPCFGLDTENILASTILHEHTHAGQAILMRTHGSIDRKLYLAGGNPTPPTIPPPGTEGKEWAEMELPAHNNEWSSRYATGISYHSEYLSRVKDWLDFFDFLSKNAD